MADDLEPIGPQEAVDLYLEHREPELSEKTLTNQRYRLNSFVVWCEQEGIDNLNQLTGRDLHRFRVWRTEGSDEYDPVNKVTLRGILATLRTFLEFCAGIDAVEQGLRERVLMPDLEAEEIARDELLEADRARDILGHLDTFAYASREHVIVAILWHTGIRLGSLRAFDVDDFDSDEPCLELRHRPDTETPLKNGQAAERDIALGGHYAQVLEDYIQHNRPEATDDHGRRPLITSEQGRLTETPIRRIVYQWTRPCMVADCPHDKDPDTCEWMHRDRASGCPSSRSPHGIRRGAITRMLREGTPEEIVSDRANVSDDVLDQHYDQRSKREKMRLRREFLTDT